LARGGIGYNLGYLPEKYVFGPVGLVVARGFATDLRSNLGERGQECEVGEQSEQGCGGECTIEEANAKVQRVEHRGACTVYQQTLCGAPPSVPKTNNEPETGINY
jgi:hypothetical protein